MKKLRENPWFKLATNVYAAIGLFFVVWMIFIDTNSLRIYLSLEQKLDELARQKETLEQNITDDKKTLLQLNDAIELERYAREKYKMKQKNEDVYLIEYADSIK